jgi:hypothetical protein
MADYFFEAQISNNRRLKTSSCLPAQSDIFSYKYQSPSAVCSDEQMKHVNTVYVCVCVCLCVCVCMYVCVVGGQKRRMS